MRCDTHQGSFLKDKGNILLKKKKDNVNIQTHKTSVGCTWHQIHLERCRTETSTAAGHLEAFSFDGRSCSTLFSWPGAILSTPPPPPWRKLRFTEMRFTLDRLSCKSQYLLRQSYSHCLQDPCQRSANVTPLREAQRYGFLLGIYSSSWSKCSSPARSHFYHKHVTL